MKGADRGGAEGEDCPSMHFKHSGYALRSTVNCRSSATLLLGFGLSDTGRAASSLGAEGRATMKSLSVFETSLSVCARGRCHTARSASLMSSAAAGRPMGSRRSARVGRCAIRSWPGSSFWSERLAPTLALGVNSARPDTACSRDQKRDADTRCAKMAKGAGQRLLGEAAGHKALAPCGCAGTGIRLD